jgi:hypothetical protein
VTPHRRGAALLLALLGGAALVGCTWHAAPGPSPTATSTTTAAHAASAATRATAASASALATATSASTADTPAATSAPADAASGTGWQAVAPGLDWWRGEPGLHVLRIDLALRRLSLTTHAERGRTIDGFDGAPRALAAFNASFFDRSFRTRGHSVSAGQAWPEPLQAATSPLLACDAGSGTRQRCTLQLVPPVSLPATAHVAVAGTPWLVRQGQARTAADDAGCAALCGATHPRTALGLSADGKTLIVLLAEGRRHDVPGLTLAQTAERLRAFGAHDAFNLDGGGSSSLLVRGRAVMQRPANEPAQRRIANAVLVS